MKARLAAITMMAAAILACAGGATVVEDVEESAAPQQEATEAAPTAEPTDAPPTEVPTETPIPRMEMADIAAEVGLVCDNTALTATKGFSRTPADANSLVIIDAPEWNDQLPEAWQPVNVEDVALVGCLQEPRNDLIEACGQYETTDGEVLDVNRYQVVQNITLYDATTGERIGFVEVRGTEPEQQCTEEIAGSSPDLLGSDPIFTDSLTTLGYWVEGLSIAAADSDTISMPQVDYQLSGGGSIWVSGLFEAPGEAAQVQTMTIAFLDGDGSPIGENVVNRFDVSLVNAGSTLPVRIFISEIPADTRQIEVTAGGGPAEGSGRTNLFEVVSLNFVEDGFLTRSQGQVRNDSGAAVEDISIVIAYFDADGNLVEVNDWWTEPDELAPGATGTFDMLAPSADEYETYEVYVEGVIGN